LKAAKQAADDGEVRILLLGNPEEITSKAQAVGIENLGSRITIVDPLTDNRVGELAGNLFKERMRRGVSKTMAIDIVRNPHYFATMMLKAGWVDAMVGGIVEPYAHAVKPLLELIRPRNARALAGVYMMVKRKKLYFLADCTLHIDPSASQLAEIAIQTAAFAKAYSEQPIRVAMLSFASFGASSHPETRKVAEACELVRLAGVDFEIDGEMQVDVALNRELRELEFPFCRLTDDANVLIFPNLGAGNTAYKLLTCVGDAAPTGPILVGLDKPAHILQRSATTREILDMIYLAAHDALT
jgi:malate dehydrogenase (oxaloacetate-decarboxylating)(NADP+)